MTKRPWVIHPFLVGLLPILYLYSRNLGDVEASSLGGPIILTTAATLVVWSTLRLCRLDGARAGLILSVALLLFFSFGHGARLATRLGLSGDRTVGEILTLGVEALALGSVIGLVLWKPGLALRVNSASNAASIALMGFSLVDIGGQALGQSRDRLPDSVRPVALSPRPRTGRPPDVYFLVLDAYGRSDVLKDRYGFDNEPFLRRLERKGFVVARRSRANYCQTALSLAATLNLRYLDEMAGSRSSNRLPLKHLIAHNSLFQAFRQHGYRLRSFASGFDATENLGTDLALSPSSNLETFHALVSDQTPLWLLLGRRAMHEPHRMHRDRILKVLDELPAASIDPNLPTLTFAHVLAPHPPFVFGPDGQDLSGSEGSYTLNDSEGWCRIEGHEGPEDYVRRYRDQVSYITCRVEQAIDRILAVSTTTPIIIIQGDHGPGAHFDSGSARPNDLQERMGILNLCLVPETARRRIDDAITPINTWRVVLDECLGSRLGKIEDRSYYSAYMTPYVLSDVTGEFE